MKTKEQIMKEILILENQYYGNGRLKGLDILLERISTLEWVLEE